MEEIKKELESGRIVISEDVVCTIASIATSAVIYCAVSSSRYGKISSATVIKYATPV